MKAIVEKDRIGTVRVNYRDMTSVERLAFCRDGTVDEKYILRNPLEYSEIVSEQSDK